MYDMPGTDDADDETETPDCPRTITAESLWVALTGGVATATLVNLILRRP